MPTDPDKEAKFLAFDAAVEAAQTLAAENTRLRAALANSDRPCVYCTLPADEWAKCQSGFPGCARADDAVGCPELGAMLELSELRELIRPAIDAFDAWVKEQQAFRERYMGKAAMENPAPRPEAIVLAPLKAGMFYDLKKWLGE